MDKERFNHRVTVGILAVIAVFVVLGFLPGAQLFAGLLGLFQ
jgi:hypothetical protein